MADQQTSQSEPTVEFRLSLGAAAFLRGAVQYMNQQKILPGDDAIALRTSAWMEEIEAVAACAVREVQRG